MPASRGNPLRVLICYGGLGVAWLVAPATVTQNLPAYQPALKLVTPVAFGIYPFRIWGALLICLAVGVAWSLRHPHRNSWAWSTAMCMFWTFWVVEFLLAAVTTGGGWAAPFYALIPAWYAFERATPPRRRKG
jgi:hypothetical protein